MPKDPFATPDLVKIGDAARILGVSIDTLRRWEKAGKITPIRTPGGTRLYSIYELSDINPRSLQYASQAPSTQELLDKKAQEEGSTVIPANAGTQLKESGSELDPRLRGDDNDKRTSKFLTISLLVLTLSLIGFSFYLFSPLITLPSLTLPNILSHLPGVNLMDSKEEDLRKRLVINENVLAATSIAREGRYLEFNTDTVILGDLAVEGAGTFTEDLTAPNILYDVLPGTGIAITEGQTPTISSTDTLATVTARGSVTTTGITLGDLLNLGNLGSDPSSASNGATYYNTSSNKLRCYINGSWKDCDTVNATFGGISLAGTSGTTQTISDGDTITIAAGTGITTTAASTDKVTIAATLGTDIDASEIVDNTITASDLNATLTFSDGDFIDLAAIVHDDSALQGLRLPQATSLTNLTSGEGFLAYDSDDNQVQVYNGTSWTSISGASTTLKNAYDNDTDGSDSIIALTSSDDSIIFRNPASTGTDSAFLLFLDQLNTTGSTTVLDITQASSGADAVNITANSIDTENAVDVSATALTTGNGILLTLGSSLTTGSGLSITSATYAPAASAQGNLVSLSFTGASTNTTGNSIVTGVNIASTINTSGATGTKEVNPINIAAPTITACTGGNCTWSGVEVNTLTSGAASTITSNGVLITATGVGAGTLNGVNIGNITASAGTETAISIGSGWDTDIAFVDSSVILDGPASSTLTLQDFVTLSASSLTALNCSDCIDFDDMENVLNVDEATDINLGAVALTIDLDDTGDFSIRDVTTDIATFADTGAITFAPTSGTNFAVTAAGSGTITHTTATGAQTFTSSVVTGTTTTSGFVFDATDITSGTGMYLTTDSVTTGRLLDIATTGNTWTGNSTTNGLINIASTSTGGTGSSSSIVLNLARSGANANATHTAYGIYSSVTNTGTTSTNVGGYFTASGATNNYAAIFDAGNVGIGDTTPSSKLEIGDGTDSIQFSSVGDITFVDADGAASITGPAGGALSVLAGASQALTLTGAGASTWSTSNGLLTISGDDGLTLTAASTAGITGNVPDNITNAVDIQEGTNNYINVNTTNASENISFGNTTTNPSYSFLGTGAVTIAGSAEGTAALTLTAGDLVVTDGDLTVSGGETSLTTNSNTVNTLSVTNNTITTLGAGVNTAGMVDISSTSLTTGNLVNLETTTALTTGRVLNVSSTSTALTTGNLLRINWTPGSSTTATTADLFQITIGANGTIASGNLLNILDASSSIFSVSEVAGTSSLPINFTAAGDVSIAYDIVFTNPTASYIKSQAPLILAAGETFNSSNLTLQTYNAGSVVVESASATSTSTNGVLRVNDVSNTTSAVGLYVDFDTGTTVAAAADQFLATFDMTQNDADGDLFGIFVNASATSATLSGVNYYECLICLENDENTAAAVADAIRITSTGATAGSFTTGLDFDTTDVTTDIEFQNAETLDNNTDGTLTLSSSGTSANVLAVGALSAGVTVAGSATPLRGISVDLATNYTTADDDTTGVLITLDATTDSDATVDDLIGLSVTGSTVTVNGTSAAPVWRGVEVTIPEATTTAGTSYTGDGIRVTTPTDTQSTALTTTYNGFNISSAGALTQDTAAGTITWRGANITMPALTETTGTVSSTGLFITSGTVGAGAEALGIDMADTDITTDIRLQNSETIDNDTNGTVDISGELVIFLDGDAVTTAGLCGNQGAGDVADTDNIRISDCSGTPADIAEWYGADSSVDVGDIVVLTDQTFEYDAEGADPYTGQGISLGKQTISILGKANSSEKVLGVISTGPIQVIGEDIKKAIDASGNPNIKPVPVTLVGRVPVKVSDENGPIEPGDYLTSSSTPGVVMKATNPGPTIGKALESFTPTSLTSPTYGKVLTFVNVSFADPNQVLANLLLDSQGNLVIPKLQTAQLTLGPLTSLISPNSPNSPNPIDLIAKLQIVDDAIATQSAQLASQQSALDSLQQTIASLISPTSPTTPTSTSSAQLNLTPPEILLATGSATLADLKVTETFSSEKLLTALDADISGIFRVFGEAFLPTTTIAGDLTVDGTVSISQNSLNALTTLYLQNNPLAQNIDIFNGQVTIDQNGYLKAQTITASEYQIVEGKTSGSGTLAAGTNEVPIFNSKVGSNSRILITLTSLNSPTSPTPLTLAVTEKVPGAGFVVTANTPALTDITFDYWIINEVAQSLGGTP